MRKQCIFATSVLIVSVIYGADPNIVSQQEGVAPSQNDLFLEQVQKKANGGDAEAQCNLGMMYFKGEGVPDDDKEAFKWFMLSAKQGFAEAQLCLGVMYHESVDIPRDDKEAVAWISKAADQGLAEAQYVLGMAHADGVGVAKDSNVAIEWYIKAAGQGHVEAQYNLGVLYSSGQGIPQAYEQALKWYRKAAEQGHTYAQYNIGLIYAEGQGVLPDYEEAVKWCTKAANQGDAWIQSHLGNNYFTGINFPQDYSLAIKWWTKAAERGNSDAQYNLGLIYEGFKNEKDCLETMMPSAATDKVSFRNLIEAYKWYSICAMTDSKSREGLSKQHFLFGARSILGNALATAVERRDQIERMMSQTEIIEAQKRAKAFVEGKELITETAKSVLITNKPLHESILGFGTGFFISREGFFLTAAHVVKNAKSVRIYWMSNDYPAERVFIDEKRDIAILKVVGIPALQALPLMHSSSVKTGDAVFTLGFPQVQLQGLEPKYTDGAISSLSGAGNDPNYFQISVPVQLGNSGGPLLNGEGYVVGVVNSRLDELETFRLTGALPQNVNYALKGSFILTLLESLPDVAAQLEKPAAIDKDAAIEKAKNAVALVVCCGS